jgi:hypothetical protein
VEWQPCMNLDLTADKGELTVRDAWEGEHEVHAGALDICSVCRVLPVMVGLVWVDWGSVLNQGDRA